MINYLDGSIFQIPCNAAIHCANCQCTWGSGIVLQIKNLYPAAFKADLNTKEIEPNSKLGTFSSAKCNNDGITIYNLYGQLNFGSGKQVSYDAFDNGLMHIFRHATINNNKIINIPYNIASDRAGGDWRIIEQIIISNTDKFPDLTIQICKYTPHNDIRRY